MPSPDSPYYRAAQRLVTAEARGIPPLQDPLPRPLLPLATPQIYTQSADSQYAIRIDSEPNDLDYPSPSSVRSALSPAARHYRPPANTPVPGTSADVYVRLATRHRAGEIDRFCGGGAGGEGDYTWAAVEVDEARGREGEGGCGACGAAAVEPEVPGVGKTGYEDVQRGSGGRSWSYTTVSRRLGWRAVWSVVRDGAPWYMSESSELIAVPVRGPTN
jgi:hypothetical protein